MVAFPFFFKNSARASRFFVHFFCHHCTTTTLKCLIQRFMENANKWRRIFPSLSKLECNRKEIKFREICLHFTLSVNWNKRFKHDVFTAIAVVHAKTPHYHPPMENKWVRASLHEKTRTSASFIRISSRFRIAFRWWLGHFISRLYDKIHVRFKLENITHERMCY